MEQQVALVGEARGQYALVVNAKIPSLQPDTMLCKVVAVALNPVDAKMIDLSATRGSVGGSDFAGEVCEVGEQVTRFKKGDRIFAISFGLNPSDQTNGVFCEYALAIADLACKIPDWMSYEEASTLGIGVATAGAAVFQALALPWPESPAKKPFHVLVSGGATATGTLAIQLIKLAGLIPIATCSPANMEFVKSLGAAEAFDYHSPTCGSEIRIYTTNTLAHVLDCATDTATMKMCYEAIGTSGGKYIALDPFATHIQYTRREVKADWLMIYSLFGNPVKLGGVYGRPASSQDRDFAKRLFLVAEQLLVHRALKPHAHEIRSGGFKRIPEGIDELRNGRVKGKKLVYAIAVE